MENLSVFSPVASACGNLFVGVARPAHFVRGPSRSCAVCARGAQFSLCLQVPVVSSISVTVQWTSYVTHMTRTPQWLKKNAPLSSQHTSFHYAFLSFLLFVGHADATEPTTVTDGTHGMTVFLSLWLLLGAQVSPVTFGAHTPCSPAVAHVCPLARREHGTLLEGVPLRNTRFAERRAFVECRP